MNSLKAEGADILAVILIVLGLVLLHGLWAGGEVAILAVGRARLRELTEEERRGARSLARLRDVPERVVAWSRTATIAVTVAAGALAGSYFVRELGPTIGTAPALLVVIAASTFLFVVFGALVPIALGVRGSERWALWTAGLFRFLSLPFRPLVWIARASSSAILTLFGGETSFSEARIAPEEIQEELEEAARAGVIDPNAGRIAARALEFGELLVAEVMIPRNRVIAVPRDVTQEELRRTLLEERHTRMPIFEGTIDNVVGYLSIKDVLLFAWESQVVVVDDLVRPAYFVPETMHAVSLLREMQLRRISLAIAVEESGGMAGIVTIEDLVEELVGEIFSEEEAQVPETIHVEANHTALVLGIAPIRDVNRELDLDLPEGDGWSTIAGLCIDLAGRIPGKGERYVAPDGTVLEICEATPRRVRTVRVHPAEHVRP
ncbi:hemolysin family protein [Vulgatibacter incomptus]|uniref:Magnesium and cobalt efflux protein CorC n=1 Tax=Vulgatibacter incomptus TaxID=1391653 RepID=A0A0K1PFU8_9BACT|nr:hemolysin family protein [Vulgatibacter incomptus]AKU92390.1 Magnesium and cobalt efflux protein CorC [Vulgatibacter incomptus]